MHAAVQPTEYAVGIKLVVDVCVKLHNLAVDRGTYRKLTYHDSDVSGEYESAGRAGARRQSPR